MLPYELPEWSEPTQADRDDACAVLPEVFPGVHASVVDRGQVLFVNEVWAAVEGSHRFSEYLESIKDRTVVFDSVLSPRLRTILEHRGYVPYGGLGMSLNL